MVIAWIIAFASCFATLATSFTQPCTEVITRREWRDLSPDDKSSYLDAVQCIRTKPALTPPFNGTGVLSRYDDLVYTHIQQTLSIHYVGQFLPWHRYITAVYEHMLRTECGYTGAQPYWDWTRDVSSETDFVKAPVFDPELGFGGNGKYIPSNTSDPFYVPGRDGGGCVTDGPFSGINDFVHLGPQNNITYTPRCLRRDFSPSFAMEYLSINQTLVTLGQEDFGWFARVVEGEPSFSASGIHGGGHYGVGGTLGEMGDLYASPSDPIFYLHHANLDRVWWSWQAQNLAVRLHEISGPIYLMDYDNLLGGNVTLAFEMTVGESAPNVTVGDVMNITSGIADGIMCYGYDRLYAISTTK